MTVRKTTITVASAAALAIAMPAIKKSEGYWPTVKGDKLANNLPTGGYGETENVRPGETHDEKYWSARLMVSMQKKDREIGACIHVDLPPAARAMALSTAYNAGSAAVCKSPMVTKWNAGDVVGGCNAMRGWRTGSHPYGPQGPLVIQKGLINRRNHDADTCLGKTAGEGVVYEHALHHVNKTTPKPPPAQKRWWTSWVFKQ